MIISLVIPTKNEAGAIGRVLKEIPRSIVNEIIIVDGHSTDTTAQEANAVLRPRKDTFILQTKKGFGNALLQGFKTAKGDIIIIMNGDGSHNPKNIPELIKKIREGNNYVMASRYIQGGRSDDDTLIRYLGNRTLTLLTNLIHKTNVTDSLYFFTAIVNKELRKLRLNSAGFELCIETLIKAHKAGLSFAEVPVVERPRFAGKSKVNAFRHGFKILLTILKRYN